MRAKTVAVMMVRLLVMELARSHAAFPYAILPPVDE